MLQPLPFTQVQSARIYNGRFIALGLFGLHLLLNFFLPGWQESEWVTFPITLLVGAIIAYFWNWQFGLAVALGVVLSRLSWLTLRYVYDIHVDDQFFAVPALWSMLCGFGAWYIADALYVRFRAKRPGIPADITGFSPANGLFIALLLGLSLTLNGYVQGNCGISDPIRYAGGCLRSLEVGHIERLAISANGAIMAVDDGLRVDVQRVSDGSPLESMSKRPAEVPDLAISADGHIVASAMDRDLNIWRGRDETLLQSLELESPRGRSYDTDLSADGKLVAAELYDTIRVWRVEDKSLVHEFQQAEPAETVVFSPDSKLLATNQHDKINLWDLETGKLARTLTIPAAKPLPRELFPQISFSADGQLLAVAYSSRDDSDPLHVFATTNGTLLHSFQLTGKINALTFSPDGQRLFAASQQNHARNLQVWDTQSGSYLKRLPLTRSQGRIAMLPDNRTLVVHDSDHVYFWDVPATDER